MYDLIWSRHLPFSLCYLAEQAIMEYVIIQRLEHKFPFTCAIHGTPQLQLPGATNTDVLPGQTLCTLTLLP